MKLFRLSLSRMYASMTTYRLTFVIFSLGAILSSFVFIYFYGNAMKEDISVSENRFEYRSYMVNFSEHIPLTEEHLRLLDDYGIKEVQVGCSVTLPDQLMAALPQGSVPRLYAMRNNGELLSEEEGGRDLTEEQLSQTGLLVDKIYGTDLTQITVNGMAFPVLGWREHTGGMMICSMETYLRMFHTMDYILYVTTDILSERQQNEVRQILEETYPEISTYLIPDYFSSWDRAEQHHIQRHAGLMYVVSLLSFLFLFQYLQEKHQRENIIYRITGCKRSALFWILLLEILTFAAATCLIACVVHAVFYDAVFCKLNMTETYISYGLGDYLTILCATVGLAVVASLPFLISCLRKAPIDRKNRYEI